MLRRRHFLTIAAVVPAATSFVLDAHAAPDATPINAKLIRDPGCSCCGAYARYLDKNGFAVTLESSNDMTAVYRRLGIPAAVAGCHAMVLQDGYVISGLVPVAAIRKLLSERPDIHGISLPGMPPGAPGMMGEKTGPFTIMAIVKNGTSYVFDSI